MEFLKFKKVVFKALNERKIGVVKEPITIEVPIDNSEHGDERKYRHVDSERGGMGEISDAEIKMTIEEAMPDILKDLVNGVIRIEDRRMDIVDEFVVKNNRTHLNVVAVLKNQGEGKGKRLYLRVITVMRKKDFRPTKNTKKTYYVN